ncbi:MAG: hypothetical protein OEZ34_11340 [Spirochaetia bacterium]|nr:hypothetical protein [Spirochaetia bacterium]
MAESIKVKVQCHACGNSIEGSAKYGSGHYVQQGVPFEFTAVGKFLKNGKKRIKGEVVCICPNCSVRNKYIV